MGYAKERKKLEQLLTKIDGINAYNEKNLLIMVDGHEKYSHTVRILKNKEPETFGELYTVELQEVKDGRKAIKESETDEAREASFANYKAIIIRAVEKTIKITQESV